MRYRSSDEDSARWDGFPFRRGDIVISTRSKSGTTWVQMICALLVFQSTELPARLTELSPWLDWLIIPRDEMLARLERQKHRRFIKTHTPLDGIPIDPRATYLVVARHPLDMAVSLFHQGANLNRARIAELTAGARSAAPPPAATETNPTASPSPAASFPISPEASPTDDPSTAASPIPAETSLIAGPRTTASPLPPAAATAAAATAAAATAAAATGRPSPTAPPPLPAEKAGHPTTTAPPPPPPKEANRPSPTPPPPPAAEKADHRSTTAPPSAATATATATATVTKTKSPSMHDSLLAWIDRDVAPEDELDSLPGVMWHLHDAWRRRHEHNVVLVHYADLLSDLDGEMRRIADRLGIEVPEHRWPELVDAARFSRMQAKADQLAPDPAGIMKDRNAFFRRGSSGAGRDLLTDQELTRYEQRAAELAPPDLLTWLHR
jgi:hypothetical protein